jgi:hypothetical protein
MESFRFRVLNEEDKPTERAQLYIEDGKSIIIGNISFEEISKRPAGRYIPKMYEITGQRKMTSEEAHNVLNHFYSMAYEADGLPFDDEYKKGIKFKLNLTTK